MDVDVEGRPLEPVVGSSAAPRSEEVGTDTDMTSKAPEVDSSEKAADVAV